MLLNESGNIHTLFYKLVLVDYSNRFEVEHFLRVIVLDMRFLTYIEYNIQ
jgi:hypothetical protein